jgi:hypothetical protein
MSLESLLSEVIYTPVDQVSLDLDIDEFVLRHFLPILVG